MATKTWNVSKDTLLADNGTALGGGADPHLPVGYWSGYRFRAAIDFTLDWTGVTKITSAVLWLKTTSQVHVGFGSDPDIYVERITSGEFTENSAKSSADGGSGWSTSASNFDDVTSTTTGRATKDVTTAESTWISVDVTDMIEAVAPASVKKRDGTAGGGASFYGFLLKPVNDSDSSETTEFYGQESSADPYIVLTYSTNTTPSAPINVKVDAKASGSEVSVADTNYLLTFTGVDPDAGDTLDAWDYELDTTSANGVAPDWTGLVHSASSLTDGITGQNVSRTMSWTLSRGTWYALRVRTRDESGTNPGAWSSVYYFQANTLPVVSSRAPGSALPNRLAGIHNLAELALWTLGGAHAKPILQGVTSEAPTAVRFRIYTDSGLTSLRWDSGKVLVSGSAGATVKCEVGSRILVGATAFTAAGTGTAAVVLGTSYWWTMEVWDAADEANAPAGTEFRVRWAQGLYEHNAGAGSSAWNFSAGDVAAGTSSAFIFRSAATSGGDAATGKSSWSSAIGSVPVNAYAQVLVRLATTVESTQPNLPDMTFSYLGSASTPDRWIASPGGEWSLDPAVRRYGSQAYKCTVASGTTGDRVIYPTRGTASDPDLSVTEDTDYVLSAFVRTSTPLTGGSVKLGVFQAGSTSVELTSSYTDTSGNPATTDTGGEWRRLILRFRTALGVTSIRPFVRYTRTSGVNESFHVDAVMLEEGTLASTWTPGLAGEAVTLDVNGIVVDGLAGGIARFRGSTGGSRDQFELGPRGLLFTDLELWSPSAEVLRIGDGTAQQTLEVDGPSSGTAGGQVKLLGAGANADLALWNEGGVFRADGAVTVRRGAAADGALAALVTGDSEYRALLQADGKLLLGPGNGPRDVELSRAGANRLALASGDTIEAPAMAGVETTSTSGTVTVKVTTAGTYYAPTGLEVSFTPSFIGQRFLIVGSMIAHSGSVAGSISSELRVVDGSNTKLSVVAASRNRTYTNTDDWGSHAWSGLWTADAVATRKAKVYVTHPTNGTVVTTAFYTINVIPLL